MELPKNDLKNFYRVNWKYQGEGSCREHSGMRTFYSFYELMDFINKFNEGTEYFVTQTIETVLFTHVKETT